MARRFVWASAQRWTISVAFSALALMNLASCATSERATRDSATVAKRKQKIEEPTTLATYRVQRQIAMHYRLDLQSDNQHSPAIAEVMNMNDRRIRACYSERLGANPKLKGEMRFAIRLSKRRGGIDDITLVGGDLSDRRLESCLKERLSMLPLNPPRDMRGTLTYRFDASERASTARASGYP